MMGHVELADPRETDLVVGERIRRDALAAAKPLLLPITEVALRTDSSLAASASSQTPRILARAALNQVTDPLAGIRENIILARLIPVGAEVRSSASEPRR